MTALRAEGCGRLSAAGCVSLRSGGDSGIAAEGCGLPLCGNAYKVSVTGLAFSIIRYDKHYGNQPPPVAFPPFGALRHQRGNLPRPPGRLACFPTPAGRLYGFRRQRRYKKWRRRRRTSPAQRYYITPEGESPQPACKAKPITGRTLAAQGRKARRLAQPSRP